LLSRIKKSLQPQQQQSGASCSCCTAAVVIIIKLPSEEPEGTEDSFVFRAASLEFSRSAKLSVMLAAAAGGQRDSSQCCCCDDDGDADASQ